MRKVGDGAGLADNGWVKKNSPLIWKDTGGFLPWKMDARRWCLNALVEQFGGGKYVYRYDRVKRRPDEC